MYYLRYYLFVLVVLIGSTNSSSQALFINEVLASNDNSIIDNAGELDDWIEIYNPTSVAINLAGYYMSDDALAPLQWQIPTTDSALTTVPPNGFLILWADNDLEQGAHHLGFKLGSGGEDVLLVAPDGTTIIDQIAYPALLADQSYGRTSDGGVDFTVFGQPTPNDTNNGSLTAIENPIISPASGQYSTAQTITISSTTAGVSVYYTTDGSEPTISSTLYTVPFVVDSTQSVRAIGIQAGFLDSNISTASYIFYDTDLPIISITTDPANLWGDSLGIYTVGTNGVPGCGQTAANYWVEDEERPANIVMLESDGTLAFQTDAGIEISGGCSRLEPQKSLNLKARSSYGASHFEHQVFPGYEQDAYKRLKLRNGGSNFKLLHMRESLHQSLVLGEVDIDQQRSRASVVFLNGDYWGIMYLIDSKGKNWIDETHKIDDKDLLDVLKPSALSNYAEVLDGSRDDYSALFDFIETMDLSIPENYEQVAAQIDILEYINYQIFQIYIQNTDWPGNNVRLWKEQKPNSKFRWILFDTDYGTGHSRFFSDLSRRADYTTDALFYATDPAMNTNTSNYHSTLFLRKLLENTTFKNEFIQRFATQMNTLFTTSRMQAKANEKYNEVLQEIPAHFNRWNGSPYDGGVYADISTLNMTAWQAEFDYVANEWMVERPTYMNQHILDFFDLDGTYNLSIPVDATTNGQVVLNKNEYAAPFNYTGAYYASIPMRIRAIANSGYRFSHWLETGATESIQVFTSTTDMTFTPVFVPDVDIVINEIHYNPTNGDDEFIELYNPSGFAKDISGFTFSEGFCFTFPENTIMEPNAYFVITNNPTTYSNISAPVFQIEEGALSNGGEDLVLQNTLGVTIDSLEYDDAAPWDATPDAGVFSLALLGFSLDNSLPSSWSIQTQQQTTPGAANQFALIFDCPTLNANIGDPCNDMDDCTENDIIDSNCGCIGTLIDTNNNGVCDTDELDCTTEQYPFNCEVRYIPGVVEAEVYDEGGEGVAFHDDEMRFGDTNYRPDDNVDAVAGVIGWIKNGEWIEYTLDVSSGLYTINIQAASGSSNPGAIQLSIDGTTLSTIDIQNTGGYGNYTTFSAANIYIRGGMATVLRLDFLGGSFNLDNIEFVLEQVSCEGIACDDLDDCTENDLFDTNCICAGTLIDTNDNGVCDTEEPACTGEQYPFNCDTMTIPGIVEAEFYDEGGEGIAFHDDATRFGNLDYRPDDNVDVTSSSIGWIKNGEWLEYTLHVSGGLYTINVEAASGSSNPGSIDLSIDGVFLTNIDIESTGSYGTYASFSASNVLLTEGTQVLRLDMLGSGFNLDNIEFVLEQVSCEGIACDDLDDCTENDLFDANCICAGTLIDTNNNGVCDTEEPACTGEQYPFNCDTMTIPGIVEAEFYDEGGEGIAFHDDATRFGNLDYRPEDNVDVTSSGVAWIQTGEWLEYTLDVSGGLYTINVEAASGSSNPGSIDLSIDGVFLTNIDIESTGSYGTYASFSASNVLLTEGTQVLRLDMLGSGFNLDNIEFVLEQVSCEGIACDDLDDCTENDLFDANCICAGTLIDTNNNGVCDTEEPACTGEQYPFNCDTMTIPGIVEAEFYDEGGEGIAFHDDATRFGNLDYRPEDNVDVTSSGVAWIQTGEWLEYTLDVSGGLYMINVEAASGSSNPGSIDLSIDGVFLTNIDIESTGSYGTYNSFSSANIFIPDGDNQVLRLTMLGSGFNLDKVEFVVEPALAFFGSQSPIIEETITSTSEYHSDSQVLLTPNPVQERLLLSFEGVPSLVQLELYNNVGHIFKTIPLEKNQQALEINTANLAAGVYLVRIRTDKEWIIKRFVKR